MNWRNFFRPTLFSFFSLLLISCSEDGNSEDANPESEGYQTQVYLTDAPVDNPEVQGVFVTVTDVKVNGKSLEGFQKTTLEVSALTNGKTELLGDLYLESGTTSSITLVFDHATDASGNTPGSYVLTTSGEKKALAGANSEISLVDQAEILASDDNELILDFDLRKTVSGNAQGAYSFASNSKLSAGIRAVNSLNAGTITGTVSNMNSFEGEALVAFAYEKGSYEESQANADSDGVRFSNAVSSAVVSGSNGNFSIHFLEEGDYEIHLISFEDSDNDQRLEMKGEVAVNTLTELSLQDINVKANSTTSLQLELNGLLNL